MSVVQAAGADCSRMQRLIFSFSCCSILRCCCCLPEALSLLGLTPCHADVSRPPQQAAPSSPSLAASDQYNIDHRKLTNSSSKQRRLNWHISKYLKENAANKKIFQRKLWLSFLETFLLQIFMLFCLNCWDSHQVVRSPVCWDHERV